MGHANASFTFNVYCHMLPRKRNPIGDGLASLVFGNKMQADRDAVKDTLDTREGEINPAANNGTSGGGSMRLSG